ncbi:hypothetical protein C2G38_2138425 [Gigaspora rosea]|uniref:Uncharacterized protein n=1 Tax=Gigaspora rosea TaxID=44941 RepID=A0A397VU89_9GLOM|nr:hypothetical protein C2G38_2138425 [Gigaspora rosea]
MPSKSFFNNDSSLNDFYFKDEVPCFLCDCYFEVNFPMIELNLENAIKPTKEITVAIENALNNERPYQELIKVFNKFGYLLSKRLTLGQKLYRSCILFQKELNLINQSNEIKENYSSELYASKLYELLDLWKNQYGFDEEYLISISGETIGKNDLEKWLKGNLKQGYKLLQIISRSELIPLYEIFENPIIHEIKSILGIDNLPKILMTGIVQIVKDVKCYNVDFPSHLGNSNYHIFAKLTRSNKQSVDVIDEATVKIQSGNRTGFLAIIENFDKINMHTRELSILSVEHQEIILYRDTDKPSITISVPENLPKNSRMAISFDFPLSSDFYSKTQDGKIELKIDHNMYDYDVNNDNYVENPKPESESIDSEYKFPLNNDKNINPESGSESDCVESESEYKLPLNHDTYFEDVNPESGSESDCVESESSSINFEYKFPLYSYIFTFNKEFIKADISDSESEYIYLKAIGSLIS